MEVYRNSSERLSLSIYSGDTLTNAENDAVVVTVTDVDTGQVVANAVPAQKETTGIYFWVLPLSVTRSNRRLKLVWGFNIQGEAAEQIEIIDVVTPYVLPDEVREAYPWLADKTNDELKRMERLVRYIIDSFTGTSFGSRYGTITVRGIADEPLKLTERLYKLESVTTNGFAVTSNYMLDHKNLFVLAPNTFPFATYYDVKSDTVFSRTALNRSQATYVIKGWFGWEFVPPMVNLAAKTLVAEYFSDEARWREANVDVVTAADWRIEFASHPRSTTGNANVDIMLQNFIENSMEII